MPKSRHRNPSKRNKRNKPSRPTRRVVMARDLPNKHILDTSAWNAFFDDPRRDEIVAALLRRNIVVLPTALSISEISATPSPERRHELLRFVKTVGRDNRPLAL